MRIGIGISRHTDTIRATEEALRQAIDKVRNMSPVFIMTFPTYDHDYRLVQHTLTRLMPKTPILGGSSVSTFSNEGIFEHSAVVILLAATDESTEISIVTSYAENIDESPIAAVMNALSMLKEKHPGRHRRYYNTKMLFSFMHGTAWHASQIVEELILNTQMDYAVVGGLASMPPILDEKTVSFVFTEDGVWDNGLVIGEVLANVPVGIAVEHGWRPLDYKQHVVTSAKGNTLIEVDGQAALEFFLSIAKEHGDKIPSDVEKLSDLLHKYQIGITLPNGKFLMRTPLIPLNDGRVVMTTPLPENSKFMIMSATQEDIIESMRRAVKKASYKLNGMELSGGIIIECLGRKEILKERIHDELDVLNQLLPDVPFMGYHSFGEIAWLEGELSGFHNMTIVVVLFGEEKIL